MFNQEIVNYILKLTNPELRKATARDIAVYLNVDNLLILTPDTDLGILLPAPGFPETLPNARDWRRFLDDCLKSRKCNSQLQSPYTNQVVEVHCSTAADNSVLALLGGHPNLEKAQEVLALLPLLGAVFTREQHSINASVNIAALTESAQTAKILTLTLDKTRQELQDTLKALRTSEEWFATTLSSIGDAVIATKTDSTISYMNKVAEELTGWTHAEALGKPLTEIFNIINESTRQPAFNPVAKVIKENIIVGLENHTALVRRDGSEITIEDSAAPIRSNNGELTGVVLVFRDSTEKAKLENEIKRSNKDLGQFAAVAAHDLKAPINSMVQFTELLAEEYKGEFSSDADQYIDFIVNAGKRMTVLIDQLLVFAHVGKADEESKNHISLKEVVGTVRKNLLSQIQQSQACITTTALPTLFANEVEITQLFQNLISNGIKFTKPKEIPQIHISCTEKESEWLIAISDLGIGIDKKNSGKVFEFFGKLHGSSQYEGSGIGLAVCKRVVETHGGKIWFESLVNKGSTFYFSFPKGIQC